MKIIEVTYSVNDFLEKEYIKCENYDNKDIKTFIEAILNNENLTLVSFKENKVLNKCLNELNIDTHTLPCSLWQFMNIIRVGDLNLKLLNAMTQEIYTYIYHETNSFINTRNKFINTHNKSTLKKIFLLDCLNLDEAKKSYLIKEIIE